MYEGLFKNSRPYQGHRCVQTQIPRSLHKSRRKILMSYVLLNGKTRDNGKFLSLSRLSKRYKTSNDVAHDIVCSRVFQEQDTGVHLSSG